MAKKYGKTAGVFRARSHKEGVSVNTLVLKMIRQALGQEKTPHARQRFTDLDELRGSWSTEEATEFDAATALFRQIDETKIWR